MSVYVWDVLVSWWGSSCPKVDVLVVWWWENWLGSTYWQSSRWYYWRCGCNNHWYPWGAILCEWYEFSPYVAWAISVTVGRWEVKANKWSHCAENSQFLDLIAYSWCGWASVNNWQSCPRWADVSFAFWWYWWAWTAWWAGYVSWNTIYWWTWWNWIQTDIDWTMRRYAWWAWWWWQFSCQWSNYSIVLWQHWCWHDWCWWSGHPDSCYWCDWIVVVRYKTDWSCWFSHATWGCKYTCWDYTIHCFTSSDTFCITG